MDSFVSKRKDLDGDQDQYEDSVTLGTNRREDLDLSKVDRELQSNDRFIRDNMPSSKFIKRGEYDSNYSSKNIESYANTEAREEAFKTQSQLTESYVDKNKLLREKSQEIDTSIVQYKDKTLTTIEKESVRVSIRKEERTSDIF